MMADPFAATRVATDASIQQVSENAEEIWKVSAFGAVIWCARQFKTFTADEVWERLDELGVPGPHTPSALGPIFLQAKRDAVIKNTGEWQPLSRFARRHRALRIWNSLLYKSRA
jgi:alkylation response protein AidB-like acyl-CoA dehydrogenase